VESIAAMLAVRGVARCGRFAANDRNAARGDSLDIADHSTTGTFAGFPTVAPENAPSPRSDRGVAGRSRRDGEENATLRAVADERREDFVRERDRADKLMAELLKTTSGLMAAKEAAARRRAGGAQGATVVAQARGLRTLQTRGLAIERASNHPEALTRVGC
jgi:hypothetical protein